MLPRSLLLCLILSLLTITDFAQSTPSKPPAKPPVKRTYRPVARVEYGTASFYAKKFQGHKTASRELYDSKKMTAAHNHLPFGTWIRVTNTKNGRSVVVRVNDRLHRNNKRVVDLSYSAASKLGYIAKGIARVKVEILGKTKPRE